VPHHLLDVLDPTERFSAGSFARRAGTVLDELERRGKPAIVVGGSGLYLRALLDGLAEMPAPDPAVREELSARWRVEGLTGLLAELRRVDPVTAARLAPGDKQRILRALEVARSTGCPLSVWLSRPTSRPRWTALRVGLTLPRRLLYDRIGSRVLRMIEAGWLDEVRGLLAAGVEPTAPAFQAIGYADWIRHLAGEIDFDTAVRRIGVATRRFAKRQETWFRRDPDIEWRDARRQVGWASEIAGRLEE
ncbi:MAG: tRNA (adenosine(37)-N6)-dimethylallyltransferase MiaA, partial [Betaproteobacteria bacterium]|nr:tRNA (adenosine(37)-N6)-dimethylallyltransferase MiaA [Betaproteobacteria bacterium]